MFLTLVHSITLVNADSSMNKYERIIEALHWFLRCLEEAGEPEPQRMTWRRRQQGRAFRRWLRSPENVAAFADAIAVHALLERWVREERSSEAATSTVVSSFVQGERPVSKALAAARPVMTRRRLVANFAGLGLGVGVGIGVGVGVGRSALTNGMGARPQALVESGHVVQVALRDGVMQAARHTSFRLQPSTQAHTVHLLSGQAAFDLRPHAHTTTRVTTPLGEILATGARVAVRVLGPLVEITVAAGSARILPVAFGASAMVLRAGQQLTLRRESAAADVVAGVDAEREFSWTKGTFNFDGETIGEAATAFNLFNELQIDVSPEVAALLVGTHQCSLTDPLLFLRRIASDFQLDIRQDGTLIRVSKRHDAPEAR